MMKIQNGKIPMMVETKNQVTLPVKFPLLLAQGVEGIAVDLLLKLCLIIFKNLLMLPLHN